MRYMMIIKVPAYVGQPPQALQVAMGELIGGMMQRGRIDGLGALEIRQMDGPASGPAATGGGR